MDLKNKYSEIISFEVNFSSVDEKIVSRATSNISPLTSAHVVQGECDSYGQPLYLHILEEVNPGNELPNKDMLSRGEPTSSVYETIGITGIVYDDSSLERHPNFMFNECINSPYWKSGRYWPNDFVNLQFYAFSPYNANGFNADFPIYHYIVPDDPLNQMDILFAESKPLHSNDKGLPVELMFKHPLTAIQFVASPSFEPGEITYFKLSNVCNEADFDVLSNKWINLLGRKGVYEVKFNDEDFDDSMGSSIKATIEVGNNEAAIFDKEATLMMIPQKFSENNEADIEIHFTDNLPLRNKHIVKFKIKDEWMAGKKIRYSISTNPNFIEKVFETNIQESINFSHDGELIKSSKSDFYIKSYSIFTDANGNVKYQEIPFEISMPSEISWISVKLTQDPVNNENGYGTGCYKGEIIIEENTDYIDEAPHDKKLQAVEPISQIYNLSNQSNPYSSVIENTANCYVINAPGTYKLPLIFGNAIKNGIDNPDSYTNPNPYEWSFMDYNGDEIISPTISGAKYGKIVWQDVKDMITESTIKIVDNFLVFDIYKDLDKKDHITHGNAILAVCDNKNKIMWSWHIWFTDFTPSKVNDISIGAYNFMSQNLGWCDGKTRKFNTHSCKIEFISKLDNTPFASTLITQEGASIVQNGNCTYYQWGRKDPFPGGYASLTQKDIYGSFERIKTKVGEFIFDVISNPDKYYYLEGKAWHINTIKPINLWDATRTGGAPSLYTGPNVKSIYDPCPVGYKVPNSGALSNLVANLSYNYDLKSAEYKFGDKTLLFPSVGYRKDSNGRIEISNGIGRYWSAEYNGIHAYHLCFSTNEGWSPIVHYENNFISQGLPVKPIRE